jgi:hypothetical protein
VVLTVMTAGNAVPSAPAAGACALSVGTRGSPTPAPASV